MTAHDPALVAQAIHDVTCPEGSDCRDRLLHSAAQPLAHTGVLARFLDRLAKLEAPPPKSWPLGPGEDDAEVWLPPLTDCLDFGVSACPHCEFVGLHHRTQRCANCGRRR
jgi:hypothetical protein